MEIVLIANNSLIRGAFVSALLLASIPATAQTFFGSGSATNGATNAANVGLGYGVLYSNTTGGYNLATGGYALYANTTGHSNTANGYVTLFSNTTGGYNTANGVQALYSNATGNNNTANGFKALHSNRTGSFNTANGVQALYSNATGDYNLAFGYEAGYNLMTGSHNIDIGNKGLAAESGTIRIGTKGTHTATLIAGINGVTSSSGVAVFINSTGQLGTLTSSRRFKKDVKTMGTVSEKLLQLRPVTFRYKSADETGAHPIQYGLIAEEVAKVAPDLVQYDKAGKPFTVRYHLLTPMLLNELQKERASRKAESIALNTKVVNLSQAHKAEVTSLKAQVSTLTAKLASMEQTQAEQKRLLNQLAAYVQNSKQTAPAQKANFVQR